MPINLRQNIKGQLDALPKAERKKERIDIFVRQAVPPKWTHEGCEIDIQSIERVEKEGKDLLKIVAIVTKDGVQISRDHIFYFGSPSYEVPDGTFTDVPRPAVFGGGFSRRRNQVEDPPAALKKLMNDLVPYLLKINNM